MWNNNKNKVASNNNQEETNSNTYQVTRKNKQTGEEETITRTRSESSGGRVTKITESTGREITDYGGGFREVTKNPSASTPSAPSPTPTKIVTVDGKPVLAATEGFAKKAEEARREAIQERNREIAARTLASSSRKQLEGSPYREEVKSQAIETRASAAQAKDISLQQIDFSQSPYRESVTRSAVEQQRFNAQELLRNEVIQNDKDDNIMGDNNAYLLLSDSDNDGRFDVKYSDRVILANNNKEDIKQEEGKYYQLDLKTRTVIEREPTRADKAYQFASETVLKTGKKLIVDPIAGIAKINPLVDIPRTVSAGKKGYDIAGRKGAVKGVLEFRRDLIKDPQVQTGSAVVLFATTGLVSAPTGTGIGATVSRVGLSGAKKAGDIAILGTGAVTAARAVKQPSPETVSDAIIGVGLSALTSKKLIGLSDAELKSVPVEYRTQFKAFKKITRGFKKVNENVKEIDLTRVQELESTTPQQKEAIIKYLSSDKDVIVGGTVAYETGLSNKLVRAPSDIDLYASSGRERIVAKRLAKVLKDQGLKTTLKGSKIYNLDGGKLIEVNPKESLLYPTVRTTLKSYQPTEFAFTTTPSGINIVRPKVIAERKFRGAFEDNLKRFSKDAPAFIKGSESLLSSREKEIKNLVPVYKQYESFFTVRGKKYQERLSFIGENERFQPVPFLDRNVVVSRSSILKEIDFVDPVLASSKAQARINIDSTPVRTREVSSIKRSTKKDVEIVSEDYYRSRKISQDVNIGYKQRRKINDTSNKRIKITIDIYKAVTDDYNVSSKSLPGEDAYLSEVAIKPVSYGVESKDDYSTINIGETDTVYRAPANIPTPTTNIINNIYNPPQQTPSSKPPVTNDLVGLNRKRRRGLFVAQVRKGGRFVDVARGGLDEVFSVASEKVASSSARSLRVLSGNQVVSVDRLPSSSRFRRSKREGGVLVEKSRFAINTPGELTEISKKGQQSLKLLSRNNNFQSKNNRKKRITEGIL